MQPGTAGTNDAAASSSSSDASREWSSADISAYLTEHMVLQRINLGITDAVRTRAANPLVHVASFLRQPLPMFAAPAPLPAPAAASIVSMPPSTSASFKAQLPRRQTLALPLPRHTGGTRCAHYGRCWRAGHGGIERSPAPLEHGGAGEAVRQAGVDTTLWGAAASQCAIC